MASQSRCRRHVCLLTVLLLTSLEAPCCPPPAGLAELDLRYNRLRRLPAALGRCTQLTALRLGWNDALKVSKDAISLLASLPSLAELELPRSVTRQRGRRPALFTLAALAAAAPHIRDVTVTDD